MNRQGDDLAGPRVRFFARLLLDHTYTLSSFRTYLHLNTCEEQVSGLLLRHLGDPLKLFELMLLDPFQLLACLLDGPFSRGQLAFSLLLGFEFAFERLFLAL